MLFEFFGDVVWGFSLFCEVVGLDQYSKMTDDHVENHCGLFSAIYKCFE